MYAKLESLEIAARTDYSGKPVIDIFVKGRDMGMDYPIHLFLNYAEAEHAYWSCMGQTGFSPYMSDGIYLARFTTYGISLLHKDGGTRRKPYGKDEYELGMFLKEYDICFDTKQMSHIFWQALRMARRFAADVIRENERYGNADYYSRVKNLDILDRVWSHTFRSETIAHWERDVAPKIRFVFHGDAKEGYLAALHDPRVVACPENRSPLKAQMQSLARIAKNSSDGEVVTVSVSPEHNGDAPMSFYWVIKRAQQKGKIMNGGLIAHPVHARDQKDAEAHGLVWPDGAEEDYHKRPVLGFEYSCHT